jgi:hypothetical protein
VRRAQPRRSSRLALVLAALAGAAIATIAAVLIGGGSDDRPRTTTTAAVPAPANTERLGSSLASPGKLVDCRGDEVTETSPSCTIFQDALPEATLVVPRKGVVRQWSVRSASGEVALAVLRKREDDYFQVSRSPEEFASNREVTTFPANLQVDAGDRLALVAIDGSGFGVREGEGTTQRYIPNLHGDHDPPKAGPTGELLLQVDYEPGGRRELPDRLVGDAAASAPDGDLIHGGKVTYGDGTPAEVRLVLVDGQGALDLVIDGTRVARTEVPGLHEPLSGAIRLDVERTAPTTIDIDVEFTRPDSARIVHHFFNVFGRRLVFVD